MYNDSYCFCTIVTKEYLLKTLALYDSICRNSEKNFHLWICAMDQISFDLLSKMKLNQVTVLDARSIENQMLLKAKKNRSLTEYCWTLKASFMKYLLLSNKSIQSILYVDSDVFLYSTPSPLFNALNKRDVVLTCHNFTPRFHHLFLQKGHFNAGIVGFKNSRSAIRILNWWERKCVEWCYDEISNNRFADQKYLESIEKAHSSVSIISSLGANAAMWNIEGASIEEREGNVFINNSKLVFFHFSSFYILGENEFDIWRWEYPAMENSIRDSIYTPYIDTLSSAIKHIKANAAHPLDFASGNLKGTHHFNYVKI